MPSGNGNKPTYQVRRSDQSVGEAVKRIAIGEIDAALAEIADPALDRHEVVHEVRKHCKKLRGLVRMVRPELGKQYDVENAFFRDAASELSFLRDAQSIIECFDRLMGHFGDAIDPQRFASVRQQLVERREHVSQSVHDLEQRLAEFAEKMRQAKQRIEQWPLNGGEFGAIAGGVDRTYRRGRGALDQVAKEPTTETLHAWRKRVKYHWYHCRLIEPIWPAMISPQSGAADALSDLLGDDHDLAVLRQTLLEAPEAFGDEAVVGDLVDLIDRRRKQLQREALKLGRLLYAEKPGAMVRRFGRYWQVWRKRRKSRKR